MSQQPKSATGFRKQVLDLLGESYGDKTLVLCPTAFVKLLHGDHPAAILLSQILYWSDRTQDPDGFFYKSYRNWQTETGLSETQVRRIINGDSRVQTTQITLRDLGVETKLKKVKSTGAPTLWYRINQARFLSVLNDWMRQGDPEQCAESIVSIVDPEPPAMPGIDAQQSAASLDQDPEIESKDHSKEDHDHQPDKDSDLVLFLTYTGRFGKLKPVVKEMLREQLARLGVEKTEEVLQRCVSRGRSWSYVIKALSQEAPVAAAPEAPSERLWGDFPAASDAEGYVVLPAPESALQPVSEHVYTSWRSSANGTIQTVQDAWNAAFHQMEMQLDRASYDSWLRGAILVDFESVSNTFVVLARNEIAGTMLRQRLYRSLKRILSDVFGRSAEIRFLTAAEWVMEDPARDAIGAA